MKIKTKTMDIMKFLPAFILIILVLITSSVLAATYVWENVGTPGFSTSSASYTSLAIYNGTPYVAYRDQGNGGKATVMKYTNEGWVTVGLAGFSAGQPTFISLAIDNNSGTPYLSYRDEIGFDTFELTVMKFNGTGWETFGPRVLSTGNVSETPLAIDNSGTPYVAYQDGGNSLKPTVIKFNGISWEYVGSAGVSAGWADFISLAIDNNSGTPYVAYQDGGNSSKATVMKFNGTSWEFVGSAGFSTSFASYTSLAIYNGTPYVAYQDGGNSSKATVMKAELEPIDLNDTSLSRSLVSSSETDVGTLSPTNGISPFVFSLQQSGAVCTDENGAGNDFFTISGNTLQRKPTTPLGSYQVCVQVVDSLTENDQHAYTINVVNALDTLTLDNQTIPDDQTNVGDFSVTGGTAPMVYTLQNSGDVCDASNGADNASFDISGTTLQRKAGTTAGTYQICAQAEDSYGITAQETFTITLSAAPSDLTLSNTSLPETRTIVGTLTTVDGQPVYVYSLQTSGATCTALNGVDNLLFEIEGNALKRKSTTTAGVYDICIQTLDQNGSTFQKTFAITVTADTTPPVSWNATLSSTHLIDGDGPGTLVGSMKASISGVTYALIDQAEFPLSSNFSISADGKLTLNTTVDYNVERNYPLRILATAPDGSKAYLDYVITVMQDGTIAGAMGAEDLVKTRGVITIDVLSNDILSSGATSWDFHEIIEYPQHGTAEIGSVVYTPDAGYSGTDSVSYRACDDLGFCITAYVTINVEAVIELPKTGFAPGRVTALPAQTVEKSYLQTGDVYLSIPSLGVQTDIVGVPITEDGWDLSWLGDNVGWLQGTAFPSWAGNSSLTAHIVDAFGQPGVFKDLGSLKYGDRVVVSLYGQEYVYEVRTVEGFVRPDDTSSIFQHEEYPWLTLVTCRGYDEQSDSYIYRIVVRAVLVAVE
jgi:LPXTG-site transpeptidase (sortase) family protein